MIMAWACDLMGSSSSLGTDLTIFLQANGRHGTTKNPAYEEKWREACSNLKTYFENPQGRFGHGPFAVVRCREAVTTLDDIRSDKPQPSWAMQVIDSDKHSGIEIYYLGTESPRVEAAQLGNASEKFLDGLTHKKVVAPLSLLLQDRLPMFSLVRMTSDDARQIEVESPLLPDPVPQEFMLYTLAFDAANDRWAVIPVGMIKSESHGLTREIKWKLRVHQGSFEKGQMLFAHNALGRGKGGDATEGRLSSLLGRFGVKMLAAELMTALSENLSGMRYGYHLLSSSDVVGRSNMLSLFTEVRAGPLKGLRFYYDEAPKVTDTASDGEQVYFGWSAVNIGWAFGMSLPEWLAPIANRFDLQPKIGIVTLDTKLAGFDEYGEVHTDKFEIKNAAIYGFEAGLERDFSQTAMLRGWTGILYSWSELGIAQTKFISLRSGLDVYRDLGTIGPLRLKGLLFGSMEKLWISKHFTTPKNNANIDRSTLITDLSYQLIFCGAGVTIAW